MLTLADGVMHPVSSLTCPAQVLPSSGSLETILCHKG
jgi:hypothetical protein